MQGWQWGSSVFTSPTSQPCGSRRQFQGAAVNLDRAGVVELVEPVLQPVDLLLQPRHQAVHVGLLQGGDVADLGGVGVDGGLRAVPGVDAGEELRRGLLLGQVVDVPLRLPVGLVDRRLEAHQCPDQVLAGLHQGRDVDLIGLARRDAVERLDVGLDLRQPAREPVLDLQRLGQRDLRHWCLLSAQFDTFTDAGAGEEVR